VTETDWPAVTDPQPVLAFLRDKASDRKLRLSAVSRCRHKRQPLRNLLCRKTVEVAEQYADCLADARELETEAPARKSCFVPMATIISGVIRRMQARGIPLRVVDVRALVLA
jgi:hypothetical protein